MSLCKALTDVSTGLQWTDGKASQPKHANQALPERVIQISEKQPRKSAHLPHHHHPCSLLGRNQRICRFITHTAPRLPAALPPDSPEHPLPIHTATDRPSPLPTPTPPYPRPAHSTCALPCWPPEDAAPVRPRRADRTITLLHRSRHRRSYSPPCHPLRQPPLPHCSSSSRVTRSCRCNWAKTTSGDRLVSCRRACRIRRITRRWCVAPLPLPPLWPPRHRHRRRRLRHITPAVRRDPRYMTRAHTTTSSTTSTTTITSIRIVTFLRPHRRPTGHLSPPAGARWLHPGDGLARC